MTRSAAPCFFIFLIALIQPIHGNETEVHSKRKTDQFGDPLPPGAIARMGTMRFRHEARVTAVAFSADGQHVASADKDNHVRTWESKTGKPVQLSSWNGKPVGKEGSPLSGEQRVAYAPDGQTVALGGNDGAIQIRDVKSGKALRTLQGHEGRIEALTFSADGQQLAVVSFAFAEGAGFIHQLAVWNPMSAQKITQSRGQIRMTTA